MKRHLAIVFVPLALFLGSLDALAESGGVNWVRLRPIGPQDKPLPTIWSSPGHFTIPEAQFNELIELTPTAYRALSAFSHMLACSDVPPEFPEFGATEISEFADGRIHVLCALNTEDACHYLSQVSALPELKAEANRLGSIHNLERRLGCVAANLGNQ